MNKPKKLSEQQSLFCAEFLIDMNASAAAARVGYKKTGPSTANQGYRLLQNPLVIERLQKLTAERYSRLQVNGDRILQELGRIGLSDIRELFDDEGLVLPPKQWPEHIARAVEAIHVEEIYEFDRNRNKILVGYAKKIKLWSKNVSLELLGKHKKLFTDQLVITDKTGVAKRLLAAKTRRKLAGNK